MRRLSRKRSCDAPRFTGLSPSSASSSAAKQRTPATGTVHEKLLQRELRRLGLRFRRNVRTLPGKPDIVFAAARVAVFCDGDFWHGRRWKRLRPKLARGANAPYWTAKIKSNIQRDRRIDETLKRLGWSVLRVWETDIRQNPEGSAERVRSLVYRSIVRSCPTLEGGSAVVKIRCAFAIRVRRHSTHI